MMYRPQGLLPFWLIGSLKRILSQSILQALGSGGVSRGGVNPAYVQPRAAAGVQLSKGQEETVVTLAHLFSGLRCLSDS